MLITRWNILNCLESSFKVWADCLGFRSCLLIAAKRCDHLVGNWTIGARWQIDRSYLHLHGGKECRLKGRFFPYKIYDLLFGNFLPPWKFLWHLIRVMRRHDLTKKYLPTFIPTHLPTYLPTYVPPLENTPKGAFIGISDIWLWDTDYNTDNWENGLVTINCDTGQHSQFLRCFWYYVCMSHIWR